MGKTGIIAGALVVAMGCSTDTGETFLVDSDTLQIWQVDEALAGTYQGPEGALEFSAAEPNAGDFEVRVVVEGATLAVDFYDAQITAVIYARDGEAADVVITEPMREALVATVKAFDQELPERTVLADKLYRAINLYSLHPAEAEVQSREIVVTEAQTRSWYSYCGYVNPGGPYYYVGSVHDAGGICFWCDTHGDMTLNFVIGPDSNLFPAGVWYNYNNEACMGRCGADCGSGHQYTWDCLNHDACQRHHGDSAAASIPGGVCSDEFASVADDVLYAPNCY